MCVNNLPKVVNWQRKAGSRTCDLRSRKSDVLTTTPPGHTHACIKSLIIRYLRDLNVYQRTEIVHTDGRACCVADWEFSVITMIWQQTAFCILPWRVKVRPTSPISIDKYRHLYSAVLCICFQWIPSIAICRHLSYPAGLYSSSVL